MGDRFPFGLPSGWYVVAASEEVKPGQVVPVRYFDQELALYRTKSGEAKLIDAFCPHMGAHLGRVGKVEGDVLRCGFHGFRFDGTGGCVGTAYDGPPPSKARLTPLELREQNGLLLAWFDPLSRAPDWEVPALDDRGWGKIRWRKIAIDTHPQETTENSVDFGHFTQLHGFDTGHITKPLALAGPNLTSSYLAYRPTPVLGINILTLKVEYHVKVWGLGYSQVDVDIHTLGMKIRFWVLPVPIDDEHIDLRLGCSAQTKLGPLAPIIRDIIHRAFVWEVTQDLDVWTYKTYLDKPRLAKGDGPIAEYRRWAKQFYAEPGADVLGAGDGGFEQG